ncbi:nuclear transport factor 2 family protein [Mycolicibacterium stellerae]|uniref:nuclear transport factor 2 family protein n=1 Tax=Mycolicibacterium stellerae TaxID=2358193 RepID=UPI000F0B7AD1|nr:nuclear transport factor 2 family protein [Mycolicibacterium stellerae]
MTMPPVLHPAVRTLIDAANLGDTEAFLDAFTPYVGIVDDWGRRFNGPREIQRWSDSEFIGKRVTLKVVHFYYTDDAEVIVIAQVGGDGFNGPSTFTFRIADDRVTEMRITA